MNFRSEPEFPSVHEGQVDLTTLVSNEFGTARSIARMQIMMGELIIGGERYNGDKLRIPYDLVKDKDIEITGPDRRWKFRYRG